MNEDGNFEIKDFTVISEWERLTMDLEGLLKKWKRHRQLEADSETTTNNNNHNGEHDSDKPAHTSTLIYKEVPLTVTMVRSRREISILKGLGRFSIAADGGDNDNAGLLQKSFNFNCFILIKCGLESVMSLGTARLLLGALLMALRVNEMTDVPALVEYGDGFIIGSDATHRHSLIIARSSLTESITESLHAMLVSRATGHYQYSYACRLGLSGKSLTLKRSSDDDCNLDWGCSHIIESIELQHIFPQLTTLRLEPNLADSPIWMLSVNRLALQPSRLADLVQNIIKIAIMANEEHPGSTGEVIYKKTRMLHLLALSHNQSANTIDTERFFRVILFSNNDGDSSMASRIVKAILLHLQRESSFTGFKRIFVNEFPRLWSSLIEVLREYWETGEPLPGTEDTPDMTKTLLEQKLAMLNYCMASVKKSGRSIPTKSSTNPQSTQNIFDSLSASHQRTLSQQRQEQAERLKSEGLRVMQKISGAFQSMNVSSERLNDHEVYNNSHLAENTEGAEGEETLSDVSPNSDAPIEPSADVEADEFYDAVEEVLFDETESKRLLASAAAAVSSILPTPTTSVVGEGRKEKHPKLKLVNNPSEPLWIPYTQDAAGVMTSDWAQVQEEAVMAAGGSSRVRFQGDQLLSDMQAFKAANPCGTFIDFIRWHSPRDWNAESRSLSQRMLAPNNIWQQLWDVCTPVPISHQTLLFDPIKEAEKVLFWFEDQSLSVFFESFIPLMLSIIGRSILTATDSRLPQPKATIDAAFLDEYCHQLRVVENEATLRATLTSLLGTSLSAEDVNSLFNGDPILIAHEAERAFIQQLFKSAPYNMEKEYCLVESDGTGECLFIRHKPTEDWLEIARSDPLSLKNK